MTGERGREADKKKRGWMGDGPLRQIPASAPCGASFIQHPLCQFLRRGLRPCSLHLTSCESELTLTLFLTITTLPLTILTLATTLIITLSFH